MDEGGRLRFYVCLASGFGTLSIVWREIEGRPRVLRIFLPSPESAAEERTLKRFPAATPRSSPRIAGFAAQVGRFLEGQAVCFELNFLALDRCSEFQTRVLLAESQVPRGCVSTYGRIAKRVGSPHGARAVGRALARNPFPIVIPCHRAIRADGRLGGFQGGVQMKRGLLELEGVEVSAAGRVSTERFYG